MLNMFFLYIFIVWVIYLLVDKFLRSLKVDNFADKYVFITGCDTGFGHELAIHLDGLGFHVFAGCLTEEGEKSLFGVCSSRLNTVPLDIAKVDSVAEALQLVEQKLPTNKGIWALVNNAGIAGNFSPFELCSREDFLKVLNVNLLGPAETTRQFLPLVRKSRGRIVNITSSFGRFAGKGVPYCAAKFGLEALSDILRREVNDQGIKVSILEPGGFRTSISKTIKDEIIKSFEKASPEISQVYNKELKIWMPILNRIGLASTTLTPVIDAYTHAIVSRYPRNRYVVGNDARFFIIPMSYLPDWISDRIFGILNKLI